MRHIIFAAIALAGLAACDAPLDPNAPRIALAGPDLEARISGKTLVFTPLDNPGNQTATAVLRTDGTSTVSAFNDAREMAWWVEGQGLCFTRPGQAREPDDCRIIGWIQGNRFAVFDMRFSPPEKIADGIIRDS